MYAIWPQEFIRRQFSDSLLNAYSRNILGFHGTNMDKMLTYTNRSNIGVSQLLQQAMTEVRLGNVSVERKLQHLGNKFINASEISAHETAYNILGWKGNTFIKTSR